MRQAEGVYNQRLQNLAVTLDKVLVFFPFCKQLVSILLFLFYFYYCFILYLNCYIDMT